MNVWLVNATEVLPTDRGGRPFRTGMFAAALNQAGHSVVWWSSTYNHAVNQQRHDGETQIQVSPLLELRLLRVPGYPTSTSVRRLWSHLVLGWAFKRATRRVRPPDVIVASWPIIEPACQAVAYGEKCGIPVILDVRDLWPDTFLDLVPRPFRGLARRVGWPLWWTTVRAFQRATAIVAVSENYLRWGLDKGGRKLTSGDKVFPIGYPATPPSPRAAEIVPARLLSCGIDPRKTIFWFVGTLGQTYDLDTVFQAAQMLRRDGVRGVQIVISGDGPRASHYRKLADGLHNVVMTGWTQVDEINYLGSVAHAGLAAYREGAPQGLPNKLFEYMAFGLPILSSLKGEAEGFLQLHQCGICYQSGLPATLCSAVKTLVESPRVRAELSRNAQTAFDAEYRPEIIYTRMVTHMEEVVRNFRRERIG